MSKYKIAGVVVEMEPKYETLKQQSAPYITCSGASADIHMSLSDTFLNEKQKNNPHLTLSDCEYLWYGFGFYRKIPFFNGIMLHSSCIAVDGEGYLFSAPCGTGKSTHAELWKKHFGDRAVFINDDKPVLRIVEDKIYACGTPFSGKTNLNSNICVPVKGICILDRGKENKIIEINTKDALPKILNQMYRPSDPEAMVKTLYIIDKILSTVPVYHLYCNISDDAVVTSYEAMSGKEI